MIGSLFTERRENSSNIKEFPLYSFTIQDGVTPKTERYERSFLLKNEENEFSVVHFNDFVLNPMNLRFGAISYSKVPFPVSVSAYYNILIARPNKIDHDFMEAFLRSHPVMNLYDRIAIGSLIEKRRVHLSILEKTFVPIPSYDEQKAIGKILREWDSAIDLTERLIAEKQLRRKGLMQQLLTGKCRLPGFSGKWLDVPLRNLTTECKARNKGRLDREFVFAVTKAFGIVPMKDHVMAEDLDRYKIVSNHCFAYNPMRINIGSICMWRGGSDVLVSPDYVVFRCDEGKLDPDYFDFLRQTHRWDQYMEVAGSGGVRVRIYYEDLASFQFKIPPFGEQQKIVEVLGAATRELDLLQAKADALSEQKKGLVQHLLTGKKRLKFRGRKFDEQ